MDTNTDSEIVQILTERNTADRRDLEGILHISRNSGIPVEKLLVQLQIVGREEVLSAKAEVLKEESILFNAVDIDKDAAGLIPGDIAEQYNIVYVGEFNDIPVIAAGEILSDKVRNAVSAIIGREVKVCIALLSDLERALSFVYSINKKINGSTANTVKPDGIPCKALRNVSLRYPSSKSCKKTPLLAC